MKIFNVIIKIALALAAVAGLVYVIATYGDKIVAWAKKMLGACKCCCDGDCCCEEGCCEEECFCDEAEAEEAAAEEAPAVEVSAELNVEA